MAGHHRCGARCGRVGGAKAHSAAPMAPSSALTSQIRLSGVALSRDATSRLWGIRERSVTD